MSEKRGEEGNPRLLADRSSSGRPPDSLPVAVMGSMATESSCQQMQHIQSGDSLERPGSSLSMDVQGQCKKLCGTGVHEPIEVSDAMEMDGEQRGLAAPVAAMLGSEGQKSVSNADQDGSCMSYGNVVNSSLQGTLQEQPGVGVAGCDPNKILVSDEDCVIDRTGKFPRIEFFEHVHKQIDLAMRNVVIEACGSSECRNQEPNEGMVNTNMGKGCKAGANEESVLFGPWMTVDTRRKRANTGGSVLVKGLRKAEVRNGANRFAALGDEHVDMMEEQGNDANAELGLLIPSRGQPRSVPVEGNISIAKSGSSSVSNSAKEVREAGRVFEKAVVLPMVEGQQVSVVEHDHTGRGGKRTGREASHQGLRVRMPPDTRTISRAVLNEWVEGVNVQLTAIADSSGNDSGGLLRASVNQDRELVPACSVQAVTGLRDPGRGEDSGCAVEGSDGGL
ncbi:hypothetical protein V6N12_016550 [Hibiscus sabdariffa]|uniref:Uncharacterized protein n=1 Tax=Hibiscus sabdariffa TaxID=183260 RepID=A0ABR2CDZ0_9ROSI